MTMLEAFVKERNEALFSLDPKKIEAYMIKYTSALAAHLPKSLEPSVGQDRTKKAFPVWRN